MRPTSPLPPELISRKPRRQTRVAAPASLRPTQRIHRRGDTGFYLSWSAGVALCGFILGGLLHSMGLVLEGGTVAIAGLGPLMVRLDRRSFPGMFIGPAAIVYLFHLLGYGFGPLWQRYVLDQLDFFEQGLNPAQWGAALGLLAFNIAFRLIIHFNQSRQAEPQAEATWSNHSWAGYSLVLLLASAAIYLYGFAVGSLNRLGAQEVSIATDSFTGGLAHTRDVAFFFLGYAAFKWRRVWMVIWLGSLATFTAMSFLDGSRAGAVTIIVASGMGLVWAGLSARRLLLLGLIPALLFFPLAGIVSDYRATFHGNLAATVSLEERIGGFFAIVDLALREPVSVAGATEKLTRRLTVQTVDRIFMLTPAYLPFVGFEGAEQIVTGLIPSLLLPGKPNLIDGNDTAIRYGVQIPGQKGAYTPAVGDGYRRFGWAGIALLYAFIGSAYASIGVWCWHRRGQREYMALFIFLLVMAQNMWITTLLSAFYLLFWMIPKYFLVFWLLRQLQDVLAPARNTTPPLTGTVRKGIASPQMPLTLRSRRRE